MLKKLLLIVFFIVFFSSNAKASVTFTWDYDDKVPAAFILYEGTSSGNYTKRYLIPDTKARSFTHKVVAGTYYWVLASYNGYHLVNNGTWCAGPTWRESGWSNEVTKVITTGDVMGPRGGEPTGGYEDGTGLSDDAEQVVLSD